MPVCFDCKHFCAEGASSDCPYPSVWCAKGHWDGCPPDDRINPDPWVNCPDKGPKP